LAKSTQQAFSICGRYKAVCTEANGYMWMKVIVSFIVLVTSVLVAFFSNGAADALKIPGLVLAAKFLSTGFALVAIPYIGSCIRCRSMRDQIKFDWDLCCSKEVGAAAPSDEQIQTNVLTWQRKIRREASVIPGKSAETGAKKP
jgi:hypothetical protein